jgi:hypothetical protein
VREWCGVWCGGVWCGVVWWKSTEKYRKILRILKQRGIYITFIAQRNASDALRHRFNIQESNQLFLVWCCLPCTAPTLNMDDALEKLQYLSLVSKICTEFENHLGLTDKVLAEFVIDLADKHANISSFNKSLLENGAEFPEAFVANLYNIIQKMRPHKAKPTTIEKEEDTQLVKSFPGLALPNKKPEWQIKDEEERYITHPHPTPHPHTPPPNTTHPHSHTTTPALPHHNPHTPTPHTHTPHPHTPTHTPPHPHPHPTPPHHTPHPTHPISFDGFLHFI